MPQKDYVARGQNNKQAPVPAKSKFPIFSMIIILALVAGFAYFLWSLKENAPAQQKALVAETTKKQKSEDDLPEIPEEEWEFIKSLPEYTVEIENKQQDDPIILRLMQCGSFRKKSQAEELRARIAFQGLEAQVKTKSGRWYRVILGPYENKRLAEKDRHTLQRAKIIGCKIWNWNL
ncbi:SPOR domain-containing protein [Paraglaciecola aquimarina]|uniref:SPOR domain-containing protein n=1 Tax=Paraglaciecola aquimarina TaxID=1235557 RepID=A0ABU3SSQ2_9ALTE|nr:SPOR domain-containing protein [Paraglaciecola aquimarina]MDU0353020.1 SPOR domain-containing protein [Paraglaciecola aquimarina]